MQSRNLTLLVIYAILLLHNDTYAQNVGVGLVAPVGKLHIKGSADASQFIIDAYSTQANTNPLMRLRKSDGIDLMWIHSDHPFNSFIGLYAGSVNNAAGGGLFNTFTGRDAGLSNTTGSANTAHGFQTLQFNTTGVGNTAHGVSALQSNIIGNFNTAIGGSSLQYNTTASENTAIGLKALNIQSFSNDNTQWVSANTAVGYYALFSNAPANMFTGIENTAVGSKAMYSNTTGSYNTAIGKDALFSNTTLGMNTAIGYGALFTQSNSPEDWTGGNVAVGFNALYSNQPTIFYNGTNNTAVGNYALTGNSTGSENTAIGHKALFNHQSGVRNTAIGYKAMEGESSGETGQDNLAIGTRTLYYNSTGNYNTAVGNDALFGNSTGSNNTVVGYNSGNDIGTSNNNTTVGSGAHVGLASNNCVAIGYGAFTNVSNLALLGSTTTIECGGYANWSNFSDGRFKTGVEENVKGLDFILRLRPVTYHMNIKALHDFWGISDRRAEENTVHREEAILRKESIVMTGFVAQEVEKAAQDAEYDFDGVVKPTHDKDHYRISYASFVVPLVKAVQELSEKNGAQERIISVLTLQNEQLIKRIEKLEVLFESIQ